MIRIWYVSHIHPVILLLTTMVSVRRRDDDNGGPVLPWLTWGHLAATLMIAGFLWTEFREASKERAVVENKVAAMVVQLDAMQREIETNTRANDALRIDLIKRIDIQREDIRTLQTQMGTHLQQGQYNRFPQLHDK